MVLGVLDPNFKTPSKGSILSLESTPFRLIPMNAGSKAHEFPPMNLLNASLLLPSTSAERAKQGCPF